MYKGHKGNCLRSERGNTLLIVLLVMLVFSGIGLAMIKSGLNSVRLSSGESREQSAYYIAESGVTYTLDHVKKSLNALGDIQKLTDKDVFELLESKIIPAAGVYEYKGFEAQNGKQPRATVAVTLKSDELTKRTYQIVSIGTIGERKRTLSTSVVVNSRRSKAPVIPDLLGVYSKANMDLTNGTIEGNLMIDTDAKDVIDVTGQPEIDGVIYTLPSDHDETIDVRGNGEVDYEVVKTEINYEFTLPPFPTYSPTSYKQLPSLSVTKAGEVLTLTENTYMEKLSVSKNGSLTIDVGNKEIILYVKDLAIADKLDVKSSDGGHLKLYVENNLAVSGEVNGSEGNDLFVYVGPSPVNGKTKTVSLMTTTAPFYAALYAADANLELGGNTSFAGMIMTGGTSVKLYGTPDLDAPGMVVYAPNATVELIGTATVRGTVISNEFKLNGNTAVYAKTTDIEDNPFFDTNPDKVTLDFDNDIVKEVANQ